ncbi:MAG: molybdopterin-dependent oxidoreductase [Planctomycetes bacterium]|nr:molybdopterin-dependent oxidoreductase [Planctomycetota bacterium]
MEDTPKPRTFLTKPEAFRDVSRGSPKPHSLKGDDLVKARMTPESWRLEILADPSATVDKQYKLDDMTALDFAAIEALGKKHSVKFLKAMQCLNIDQPLGQGLWEGVPLREILRLVGKVKNVRRVFYHGFHNNDPKQIFQSSLSYNHAMETPPWELGPFVAYKLNGQPISLVRGGPVRLIVPWSYGFKSIKWLHRITLTNDYKTNDTYAEQNNDPESYLKTAAYLDPGPQAFKAGEAITIRGTAMVGWSGLKHVEYWLRPAGGDHGKLEANDPAWQKAKWEPCALEPAPADWGGNLPDGVMPKDVWGFNAEGKPKEWPLRYSVALWSATLKDVKPGVYEFRARTVDLNGFAQPEPRPYLKSGQNHVAVRTLMVME